MISNHLDFSVYYAVTMNRPQSLLEGLERGAGGATALVLAFLFFSAASAFAAPLEVDEDAAVALAIAKDAATAAARIDAAGQERRSAVANNFLLPSLTASVATTETASSESDAKTSAVLKLSSALNLSASDFKAKDTAAREAESLRVGSRVAEERIARATRKTFYRLLLLSDQESLAEGAVALAMVNAQRTNEEYRNGLSSQLVKRQAEVSLEMERLALERKRMERTIALSSFRSALGLADGTELKLSGSLEAPSLTVDESMVADLSSRSELALIAARQAVQESRIAEDRLGRTVPKFSLSAAVSSTVDDLFPGSAAPSLADRAVSGASVTLTLSSPNLTAFLPFSKELETSASLRDAALKLQVEHDEAERAARIEAETLLAALKVSGAAIQSLSASLSLAEEVLALTREAYAQGAVSFQDLRAAEKDLDKARVDALAERYTYLTTIIDLEYAVGRRLRAAKE